jgi:UDP-N-acetylglucosamine diphosphorylase/glucosamine-1-phosphate N-acetyltransferase
MNTKAPGLAVVILAAGMGTRMQSSKAKVLHEIAGKPMIDYVVAAALGVGADAVVLVVGHQSERVRRTVSARQRVTFALQQPQLGTGHAVQCALPAVPEAVRRVLVLCGDIPLVRSETLQRFVQDHLAARRDLSLLAVDVARPHGYGRVLFNGDRQVLGIVEEADATPAQRRIRTVNAGIYCIEKAFLQEALPEIRDDNAQKEFYLTDIVAIGHRLQKKMGVLVGDDAHEVIGVNTLAELQAVERLLTREGAKTA